MKEKLTLVILALSFLVLNSCGLSIKTFTQEGWTCVRAEEKREYSFSYQVSQNYNEIVVAVPGSAREPEVRNRPLAWEDGKFCVVESITPPPENTPAQKNTLFSKNSAEQTEKREGIYFSAVRPEYCYNWLKNQMHKREEEGFTCEYPKEIPEFEEITSLDPRNESPPVITSPEPESAEPETSEPESPEPEEEKPGLAERISNFFSSSEEEDSEADSTQQETRKYRRGRSSSPSKEDTIDRAETPESSEETQE